MPLIGSVIFNAFFYLSLIPITTIIISLYFFISTKRLQKLGAMWIKVVLNALKFLCGVSWKVEGIENIPSTPCIVVSNHQGQWESFFLQTLFIPSTSIIKKELLLIPLFGWALRCMKPITLNRLNRVSSLKKVIKKGVIKLKNGFSIILFPEGTRISPEKGIQPFARSCGLLSVKSGFPVLPICHNSGKYWKNKKFIKSPGEVVLRIGEPILGRDPKVITNDAYNWVKNNYEEIN
ncbi:MAG: lysophospholipid acyltransferase family protein [Gammaproteobacteria bacterium]|jgi:1-acyl-sn-glycerol-3-phosphate acyltransferase|tara:strand:- start:1857 stop:2561 length:705 start_codon:yes stop_codon:yes gene_type:complete